MGYLGVFEVAKRLTRVLKNTSLNKNLGKHAKLPYFDSWYKEDPFKYIANENNRIIIENLLQKFNYKHQSIGK